jgi:glycerol-3-phosphate dehydrogenase
VLKVDGERDAAPLVNIFGGKITTYRRLAESMLEKIEGLLGAKGPRWTGGATLPGGDFKAAEFDRLASDIADRLDIATAEAIRLARLYGTRALAFASPGSGLGLAFGHGLTEAEVSYLMDEEWAVEADDILWRRTKLGLKFSASERERLAAYMQSRRAGPKKKKVAAR